MRGYTTRNLAERLNLRRTGSPVSLALAALVVLFLAWLIFSTGGAATAQISASRGRTALLSANGSLGERRGKTRTQVC